MMGFAQDAGPAGHITWVPGQSVQAHFEDASPEEILSLERLLEPHLKNFAATLGATLLSGSLTEQTLKNLLEALIEVNQRALIRLRQRPSN